MSFIKKRLKRTEASRTSVALPHDKLSFSAVEQYKLLRANLLFTLPEDEDSHVIGITSSSRAEGKSTTAINLSYSLADAGKKVLLLDADLRLPSIAKKLNMRNMTGLSQALLDFDSNEIPMYKMVGYDDFCVIPSGSLPPNPSELLSSKRMERLLEFFKHKFDYIIIDLPPVNVVSDAVAISPFISGIVLVVREDATERKDLSNCVRQLDLSGVKVLGIVMNGARKGASSYSRYKKDYRYYRRNEAED